MRPMNYSIIRKRQSGQTTTEYVLLLVMVAGMFTLLYKPMGELLKVVEKPIRRDFKYTYKYGDPKACGYDDDDEFCSGPKRHPRINTVGNFRLFGRSSR